MKALPRGRYRKRKRARPTGLSRDVEAVVAEIIQKLEKASYVNAS